jgi:hypothetical protein
LFYEALCLTSRVATCFPFDAVVHHSKIDRGMVHAMAGDKLRGNDEGRTGGLEGEGSPEGFGLPSLTG